MRTFIALYDSRSDAEAAQRQLELLGVIDVDGVRLHDEGSEGFSRDSYSSRENRGFWASVKEMFLPDEDRHLYEEGVRRGSCLLTVRVDDQHADRVHDALEASNAVNVDEREREYRQSGWSPPPAGMAAGAERGEPAVPARELLCAGRNRASPGRAPHAWT